MWLPEGRSVYDGLLVKVQKRFAHRYQFQASYALQKLLTENAGVDVLNYFAGYGPTLPSQNFNIAGDRESAMGIRDQPEFVDDQPRAGHADREQHRFQRLGQHRAAVIGAGSRIWATTASIRDAGSSNSSRQWFTITRTSPARKR